MQYQNINNIPYPCLVVDIGTNRFTKSFDKELVEESIKKMKILECSFAYLENVSSDIDENNTHYFDIQNDEQKIKEFIEFLEPFLEKCTIVAHNAETEVKLIKGMMYICNYDYKKYKINYFCTMEFGRKYSKTHIYRKGKKIKKNPNLQELLRNLTKLPIGKGDIIDDVVQCYYCLEIMRNNEMLELISDEIYH